MQQKCHQSTTRWCAHLASHFLLSSCRWATSKNSSDYAGCACHHQMHQQEVIYECSTEKMMDRQYSSVTAPRLSRIFNWDSYLGCLHPNLGDTLSQSLRAEADWNTNQENCSYSWLMLNNGPQIMSSKENGIWPNIFVSYLLLKRTYINYSQRNPTIYVWKCKPDACSEEVVHGDFWGSFQIWKLRIYTY